VSARRVVRYRPRGAGIRIAVLLLAALFSATGALPLADAATGSPANGRTDTTGQADGDVRARIEPRIIDELETARLILRTAETGVRKLDLTALENDFEVLGTQTASQYQSVNGVVEAWVEYQVTLRPTRSGTLTIPPIQVGQGRSQPLTLEVRGIDPALRERIDRMVFFELEVSRNPVYVRGETVVTRRLYYSAQTQIYSDLPGPPELRDALVLPIGDTTSTTLDREGERYGVIEQRFAVFPERPGALTIPSISLTSSVRLPIDGRIRRTGARVSSEPVTIEVKPVPADYPDGTPWLPATAVSLRETWAPDRSAYRVGEPLQRLVEVAVTGNLAASIAPPDDILPGAQFRQYPEPAVLDDDRSGASVVGRRATRYAVVPTAPGTTRLAGLAVTWWDVEADRLRVSRTDARDVSIEGAAPEPPAAPDTATTPAAGPGEPVPAAQAAPPAGQTESGLPSALLAWTIVLALAVTLWAAGRRLRDTLRGRTRTGLARALATVGLTAAARGPARRLRLGRLRRAAVAAARSGDPGRLNAALLAYLGCWYGVPTRLAAERFRGAGHGELLDRLDAARFGRAPGTTPNAAELSLALHALREPPRQRSEPLPELFAKP